MIFWLICLFLIHIGGAILFFATTKDAPEGSTNTFDTTSPVSSLFGMLFAALSMIGLSVIIRTEVTSTLWTWFVTPTFNIPVPSNVVIYGLFLIVGVIWYTPLSNSTKEKTTRTKMFGRMWGPVSQAVAAIIVGWFMKTYLM